LHARGRDPPDVVFIKPQSQRSVGEEKSVLGGKRSPEGEYVIRLQYISAYIHLYQERYTHTYRDRVLALDVPGDMVVLET
jgi:hypothetical protein